MNYISFSPSDVNSTLTDSILYGDLKIKGFGSNMFMRSIGHSLPQYLVRMGYCTIDRDVYVKCVGMSSRNIDVNKDTRKYMRELGNSELYAVRRVG